jgi:hypothetical protein
VIYPALFTGCGGSSGSSKRFQLLVQLAEIVPSSLNPNVPIDSIAVVQPSLSLSV